MARDPTPFGIFIYEDLDHGRAVRMIPVQTTFQLAWTRKSAKTVYACSISNLVGDPAPEVVACSFDGMMHVYDLRGNQLEATEFSPEITTFLTGPVTNSGDVELLAGDLHGFVRLINKGGDLLWQVQLKAPVTCVDVGNLTGAEEKEVAVALQNKEIVILDNGGQAVGVFESPDPILDCTIAIGPIPPDFPGKIFVLLKGGQVVNMDLEGHWQETLSLPGDATCLKAIRVQELPAFLVGHRDGLLKVIDLAGNTLGDYALGERVRSVCRELLVGEPNNHTLVAAAAGEGLFLFKLESVTLEGDIVKGKEVEEPPAPVQLATTPLTRVPKPGSPVPAATPSEPEPVIEVESPNLNIEPGESEAETALDAADEPILSSGPSPNGPQPSPPPASPRTEPPRAGQFKVNTPGEQEDLNWDFKFCQACGHVISAELLRRLHAGTKVYCEVCGSPLSPQ